MKRILTLIRRNKVKRIKEKTTTNYKKSNEKTLKVIWRHEEDSMKLNELNKKKRKCFKCKKVNYIRRFCRSKENFSKEKKDTLVIFKESENENVLKKKKSQDEEL